MPKPKKSTNEPLSLRVIPLEEIEVRKRRVRGLSETSQKIIAKINEFIALKKPIAILHVNPNFMALGKFIARANMLCKTQGLNAWVRRYDTDNGLVIICNGELFNSLPKEYQEAYKKITRS